MTTTEHTDLLGPAGVRPRVGSGTVRLEALTEFLDTGRVASWDRLTDDERDALLVLGWVDADGAATDLGDEARADIDKDAHVLHLRAQDDVAHARGFALVGVRSALVAQEVPVRPSAADDRDVEYGGDVTFEFVPAAALPLLLARWGDVRPTPHVVGETFHVGDDGAFERRLRDASQALPDEADAALADVWSGRLTWWSVRSDGGEIDLTYVDAGESGQFAVRRESGTALERRPESLLWGELQRVPGRLAQLRAAAESPGTQW